jgi:hypothetical protein
MDLLLLYLCLSMIIIIMWFVNHIITLQFNMIIRLKSKINDLIILNQKLINDINNYKQMFEFNELEGYRI